ncbi:transposase InsO family protein [Salinibacter ruber]|uniref:Transposase InsO family protein n=1 Tax=Salinibacter ruber TaxID=146919 RepID=A0A9X2V6L8_9BACT|nr:transposase InsO family protein [Salinibacter ruber]MCS3638790.1 transposase InsO family protein [Salinibacter ruber]MCS3715159.1 transposase InsO family protein [Salinibacter ruber]MCS4122313.1 transposase InsO family protein [Salinibacter ruber]MCS4122316.1 transposase InsO family protein [Salinibacter ruber]
MDQQREEHGLNRCLEAIGLPKSTYYYRKNRSTEPSEEEQELMDHVREIIGEHPGYGYRRILPELEERTGQTINHKRLRRLLSEHELGLSRQVSGHSPSPVQEILGNAAGDLNLVAGLDPGPLEAFSTDFTELSYAGGNRKAYLMAVVDLESKYVPGWAVGPSANRKLAMRCWDQVRERMENLGEGLDEKIIHHDLDSVYTSYRWLRAILLDDEMHISYSENGAKGNPWIESLWGRTKAEVGSRITEASSLPALRTVFDERFRYYNQDRRHSSIGQIPPREHLGKTLDTPESEPQIAAVS